MSFVRIWIQIVWGTKKRFPYFTLTVKDKAIDHIRENAKNKGIYSTEINGQNEHIHCLISLTAKQTVANYNATD